MADENRDMRLSSRLIFLNKSAPETSLAEFIAVRRMPAGDRWSTWDDISFDLREVIKERVTTQTLRRWAQRYGIPEDTTRSGREGPSRAEYALAVKANTGVELSV